MQCIQVSESLSPTARGQTGSAEGIRTGQARTANKSCKSGTGKRSSTTLSFLRIAATPPLLPPPHTTAALLHSLVHLVALGGRTIKNGKEDISEDALEIRAQSLHGGAGQIQCRPLRQPGDGAEGTAEQEDCDDRCGEQSCG